MKNHGASNSNKKQSRQEPQIWEMSESNSEREEDRSEYPPEKWYFKPILPQVNWHEVREILSLVAAFTVCAIYWNQLSVMSDQLREIQASSSQTSQLIANAAHQAEKTKDVADAASRVSDAASDFSLSAKGINRQIQSAVSQFQRLADSAKDSLKATQDSFREDQRAWIGIIRIDPFTLKVGETATFSVIATNTGRTPAVHAETKFTAQQIAKSSEIKFNYPPNVGTRSNSVVVPGAQVTLGPNKSLSPLTKEEIESIKPVNTAIYIY